MRKYYDMKQSLSFALALLCGIFTACFDDTDLRNKVDDHENRIQYLESLCSNLNNEVMNLMDLLYAYEEGDRITSVTSLTENGVEVGYLITFNNNEPIAIYHGSDGADGESGSDGSTPQIGAKQDTDGIWYWTVNGEWLCDDAGNKVKASAADGADGKDAIAPKFKIEEGDWYVSYDNEKSWTKLGKATGEDGSDATAPACIFTGVRQDGKNVYFNMADGNVVTIPLKMKVGITFNIDNSEAGVVPGGELVIGYTLTDATAQTVVTASSDGNYVVRVASNSSSRGNIYVKCPAEYSDGFINVIVSDGEGYSFVKVINFYESKLSVSSGLEYYMSAAGGEITVPVSANVDYVAQSGNSWLTVEKTGTKAHMKQSVLKIAVAENTAEAVRTGSVKLYYENMGSTAFETITITQGSAYFSITRTDFVVPENGETYTLSVKSSRGLKASAVDKWVTTSVSALADEYYELTMTVKDNDTDKKRSTTVSLLSSDGTTVLAELSVIQLNDPSVNPNDMILTVRVNYSNDFTAYLPIVLDWESDLYIDWGDGVVEHYSALQSELLEGGVISHKYSYYEPRTVDVKLSGNAAGLDSSMRLEKVDFPHSVCAIKQWGNIGLKSMERAFQGNPYLTSLPADINGALSSVQSFDYAFADCVALETVSKDLFASAVSAEDFEGVFSGCIALKAIHDGFFDECKEAKSMRHAFSGCSGLTSIPVGLFKNMKHITNFSATFRNCSELTSIPSSLFAGCKGVTDFTSTFYGCVNIARIPESLFEDCSEVLNFNHTFSGCTSITALPEILFRNCTKALSFRGTFSDCEAITAIPEHIFLHNTKVTDFSYVFSGTSIVGLMKNVFWACPEVTDFSYAFSGCEELVGIPWNFFKGSPRVSSYEGTFQGCKSLEAIPWQLFDYSRMVKNFSQTFSGCSSVEGESPFTAIDGVGSYHLYERHLNDEQFLAPTDYDDCFKGCRRLDDYSSIPSEWK